MIGAISARQTKSGMKYLAQLPPSMGRRSKTFASREEAEEWLISEELANLPGVPEVLPEDSKPSTGLSEASTQGVYSPDSPELTVSDAMNGWLSGAVLKESTRLHYRAAATRWVIPAIGEQAIGYVSPGDIDRCLKLVPMNSTLVKVAGVLKGMFLWAEAHGHVPFNPVPRSQARRLVRLAE